MAQLQAPSPDWLTRDNDSPLLEAALGYARQGWPVIPLFAPRDGVCSCPKKQTCTNNGKHPRNGGGLTNASVDPEVIRGWWQMWTDANIGITSGKAAGFVALDVDPRHGGFESLAALGPLPQTVQAKTGSGGTHLLFAHPGNGTVIRNSAGDLAPGLDIRGDGGYIVVAPSLHASGNRYVWTSDPSGPLAQMPAAIKAIETKPRQLRPRESGDVAEGGRNQHLARLAGIMRQQNMGYAGILAALTDENRTRCNPPLEDAEVAAVAASVSRYEPDPPPAPMNGNTPKPIGPGGLRPTKRGTNYPFHSGTNLLRLDIPPTQFAVPGIITQGLTVFAAPPKTGKSWISLGLAIAISTGQPALGSTECEQGDVLYLALEDSPRRLQSRLRLLGAPSHLPRLDIITEPGLDEDPLPRANQGGLEWISEWLRTHEAARLVIIDTLAMFRTARSKNGDIYQEDYDAANMLKQLAGAYGVAFLVVHHTAKAKADDFVASVSGTNGITGAADGVLTMTRTRLSSSAVLNVTGRDVEEKAYGLREQGVGRWIIVGDAAEVTQSEIRRDIMDAMRMMGKPVWPADVAKQLGLRVDTVRQRMWKMLQAGVLAQDFGGPYKLPNHFVPTSVTHNVTNDSYSVSSYTGGGGSHQTPLSLPNGDPLLPSTGVRS